MMSLAQLGPSTRSNVCFCYVSLSVLAPLHGEPSIEFQRPPVPTPTLGVVSSKRKLSSNRQDQVRGQESGFARCVQHPWSDLSLLYHDTDYEISLLQLLEKATNGTVIEISVTGMVHVGPRYLCLMNHARYCRPV